MAQTEFSKHQLNILGTCEANLTVGLSTQKELFYVMNEKGNILIGSKTAKKKKNILVIKASDLVNVIDSTSEPVIPLSKIKNVVIELPIDKSVAPVQQPYRRISVPLELAVEQKIQRMVA